VTPPSLPTAKENASNVTADEYGAVVGNIKIATRVKGANFFPRIERDDELKHRRKINCQTNTASSNLPEKY
jgi:hypothetical protein